MKEFPKIQSIFKRDEKTHKFVEDTWSLDAWRLPEFEYLKNNVWLWTEKVNGTNIRVIWELDFCPEIPVGDKLTFAGKTDDAQIPPFLYEKLGQIFTEEKFKTLYPDMPMCLYGEGYGARIQKGGGNYISDGVDFVLFDVMIDGWWLKRKDVEDIALKLGIKTVPIVRKGTLIEAVEFARNGFKSQWGDFLAEGLVLIPQVGLKTRAGNRIVTKVKYKDFKRE